MHGTSAKPVSLAQIYRRERGAGVSGVGWEGMAN